MGAKQERGAHKHARGVCKPYSYHGNMGQAEFLTILGVTFHGNVRLKNYRPR